MPRPLATVREVCPSSPVGRVVGGPPFRVLQRWSRAAGLVGGLLAGVFAAAAGPGRSDLSILADPPAWEQLAAFHGVWTATALQEALESRYAPEGAWRPWVEIDRETARWRTGPTAESPVFLLRLAPPDQIPGRPPRAWRDRQELPPPEPGQPLRGLRVALDPGHLGGVWGRLEGRHFQIGTDPPVQEGDLVLAVARHLAGELRARGAEVRLLRDREGSVTSLRPIDLLAPSARALAAAAAPAGAPAGEETADAPEPAGKVDPAAVRRQAERWFYGTAEIRARARRLEEVGPVDLVLALHLNAAPWPDPAVPSLVAVDHAHVLVFGTCGADEMARADVRWEMLRKLLSGTAEVEDGVAVEVADALAERTGLPPFTYTGSYARPVRGHPYVWARNLLANRLYPVPVVYLEPYVANGLVTYARLQAGDYEGLRPVAGQERPSLVREYAAAVAEGLVRYYGWR